MEEIEEEFESNCEKEKIESNRLSAIAMKEMNLPRQIRFDNKTLSILGEAMYSRIQVSLDRLEDKYEKNLRFLINITVKESVFANLRGAYFSLLMRDCCDPEIKKLYENESTVEGYVESYGYAGSLAISLGDNEESVEQSSFRLKTSIKNRVPADDIFECIAVIWFQEAAKALIAGEHAIALNWIAEAYHALEFATGETMHKEGQALEQEVAADADEIRKRPHIEGGVIGGKIRASKYLPIKNWADEKSKLLPYSMMKDSSKLARKLMTILPKEYSQIADNPERVMREHLHKKKR